MADFKFAGTMNGTAAETREFAVASGAAASIAIGDLCEVANGYAAKVADGGASSNGRFGLAVTTSTDTAAADGVVQLMFSPTGLIVEGTAAGSVATAEEFDRVTLDVDGSGNQTVDEDDANGVLTIVKVVDSTNNIVQVSVPWQV